MKTLGHKSPHRAIFLLWLMAIICHSGIVNAKKINGAKVVLTEIRHGYRYFPTEVFSDSANVLWYRKNDAQIDYRKNIIITLNERNDQMAFVVNPEQIVLLRFSYYLSGGCADGQIFFVKPIHEKQFRLLYFGLLKNKKMIACKQKMFLGYAEAMIYDSYFGLTQPQQRECGIYDFSRDDFFFGGELKNVRGMLAEINSYLGEEKIELTPADYKTMNHAVPTFYKRKHRKQYEMYLKSNDSTCPEPTN